EDVVARERSPRPAGEVGEHPEFLCREINFTAAAKQLVRGEVELAVAKPARRRLLRPAPAQERVRARHQLADAEWLGDVVVGAQVQSEHRSEERRGGEEGRSRWASYS